LKDLDVKVPLILEPAKNTLPSTGSSSNLIDSKENVEKKRKIPNFFIKIFSTIETKTNSQRFTQKRKRFG
jgi:hypothetical protein